MVKPAVSASANTTVNPAPKAEKEATKKYRVLQDDVYVADKWHKAGDVVELTPTEAASHRSRDLRLGDVED